MPTANTGLDGFLEDFRRVERVDPTWNAIHLAAVAAWLLALPLSNAAEGITFGVLAAVSALRTIRTAPLYGKLFRSTPWLLLMAFVAWQALSVTWSCDPAIRWSGGLPRTALLPLMLWPLAHRSGTIAAVLGAAGAIAGALLLARNLRMDGISRYGDAKLLGKDLGMVAACISTALVTIVVAPLARRIPIAILRSIAAALAAGGLVVLSKRAEFASVPIGVLTGWGQARHMTTMRWSRRLLVAISLAVAFGSVMLWAIPRARITAQRAMELASSGSIGFESIASLTDHRSTLVQIALEMTAERPLIGWGAGGFHAQAAVRCAGLQARFERVDFPCETIATFHTSHNMLADELCMRGVVGCGLLLAMLGCLFRWCWRDPAGGIAVGILAVWCVHGMINGTTVRGTHMALLALVVSRAAIVRSASLG